MGTVHLLHFLWFTSKEFSFGRWGKWGWSAGGPSTQTGSSHCIWTSHLSLPLSPAFLNSFNRDSRGMTFGRKCYSSSWFCICQCLVQRRYTNTFTHICPIAFPSERSWTRHFNLQYRSTHVTDQSNNLILLPPSRHQSTVWSVFFCYIVWSWFEMSDFLCQFVLRRSHELFLLYALPTMTVAFFRMECSH